MSQQIPVAYVKQYNSNIMVLSQQMETRLVGAVRQESQRGDEQYFDRLGPTEVVELTSRHQDTIQVDSEHSRRRVTTRAFSWADLIDWNDMDRMLIDPTSEYIRSTIMAFNRKKDELLIDAALGTAYGGVDGSTSVTLPANQYIGAVASGALSRLNVNTLRKVQKIFDEDEVPENDRYFVFNAEQREALLSETEVTSSDYNVVKALVMGQVDTFLGFKFIRSEQLNSSGKFTINTSTGAVTLSTGNGDASDQCFAFQKQGLLFASSREIQTRVQEDMTRNYSVQVYGRASFGATRMEEDRVIGVLCKASA